ncbi:hypothetical protein ACH4MW_03855 [Streptomyces luteogriseus]|uniref:hypothetical protein n=1 Tax=Streptomyces luteogriseus TaxID=68233 RepID=UPI0037B2FB5F
MKPLSPREPGTRGSPCSAALGRPGGRALEQFVVQAPVGAHGVGAVRSLPEGAPRRPALGGVHGLAVPSWVPVLATHRHEGALAVLRLAAARWAAPRLSATPALAGATMTRTS